MKADRRRQWARFLEALTDENKLSEGDALHVVNAIVEGGEPPALPDRTEEGWVGSLLSDMGF